MNNEQFNAVLSRSYKKYLETSSRSNKKLEILHGEIAFDLQKRLGDEYTIKSLGFKEGKESRIEGRYVEKAVDIAIFKDFKSLGGIAVKYVMSNYSQNSNNYFENMLGETANLRTNGKAYFQLIIIPKHIPYFKKDGTIGRIEEINSHYIQKYLKLSEDNIDNFMHTPTKTLLCLIETPAIDINKITSIAQYKEHLLNLSEININLCNDQYHFNNSVIYNDYNQFIEKIVNYIKFMV